MPISSYFGCVLRGGEADSKSCPLILSWVCLQRKCPSGSLVHAFCLTGSCDEMSRAVQWDAGKRICHGDYCTDVDLEHGTLCDTFFMHQARLPVLPVPDLHSTLELYLSTVKALATPREFEHTVRCVAEFQQTGGLGDVLQRRLKARAATYRQSSWLQELWNTHTYLIPRCPLPLNVNPYYRFADHAVVPPDTPRPEAQAVSAARLLTALLKARDGLVDGSAAPLMARGDPYCPTSFKYLFNACRVPGSGKDEVHLYDPAAHNADRLYTLPINHPDGRRASTAELAAGLTGHRDGRGN